MRARVARHGRKAVALSRAVPWPLAVFAVVWGVLVLAPLVVTVIYSFLSETDLGVAWDPSLEGYRDIFAFGRGETVLRTFRIALVVTAIEFLIAFPVAYWLAKRVRRRNVQTGLLVLLTVPFFLSEDSRTVIWQAVFSQNGLVNEVLQGIGLVDSPIEGLLFSELSVYLGLVPIYFMTMLFPIYMAITLIDDEAIEAARDLGGTWVDMMKDVVFPLAAPGIIAGTIFTLVPILGNTVVPSLLGGGQVLLISSTVEDLVASFQYPSAAAISVLISVVMVGLVLLLVSLRSLRAGFNVTEE